VSIELETLVFTALTPHLKHLEDVMLNMISKVDKLAAMQHPLGSGTGAIWPWYTSQHAGCK
jgi:hypothetical protein